MNGIEQEVGKMSIEDMQTVLADQADLYTPDEINAIKNELRHKLKKQEEESIPTFAEVKCKKCDGINDCKNTVCKFCGCSLDGADPLQEESKVSVNQIQPRQESTLGYTVISFLFPIIGIIMGLIYIGKNEDEFGKSLIITSIVGAVIISVALCFICYS